MLVIIAFLASSLIYLIAFYYDGLFSKITIGTGVLLIGLISFIIIQTFLKKEIVCQSALPLCRDLVEEFNICARCRGFYIGLSFFGALLAIRNQIYMDLLKLIGAYPYFVITFLVIVSVPVHGSLRRLKIIKSGRFLQVIGFIFSSSIYLLANFLIFLLYGI